MGKHEEENPSRSVLAMAARGAWRGGLLPGGRSEGGLSKEAPEAAPGEGCPAEGDSVGALC